MWLDFKELDQLEDQVFNDGKTLTYVNTYDNAVKGWSRALDLREKEAEGHSQRIAEMTLRMAQELGIKEEILVHIRRGALLHDIGMMGIPDNILLKPDSLTDEEWKVMRSHPKYAYNMLHEIEYLRPALDIPYCHHEKWDGTGYPRGLKAERYRLQQEYLLWWTCGMHLVHIVHIEMPGQKRRSLSISVPFQALTSNQKL